MGELGEILARDSETVQAIYDFHKRQGDAEPQRGYLGASIIGEPCLRRLWYTFRGLAREGIEGRVYRLFETGDLAEARFVKELRAIGCEVHDVDPRTGEQFEVSAFGGHFSGHMDAAIRGLPEAPATWHVGEFKTHNTKSFHKLRNDGVEKSKPTHYAQVQAYMGHTGMKRAFYLAVNKDTDELYSERVDFDRKFFTTLMDKAERVITATQPPERAYNRPDSFGCKWCPAHELCWGVGEVALPIPEVTCRSCSHATPDPKDGRWICSLTWADCDPCDDHIPIPGLLVNVHPVEAGPDWIEFTHTHNPHAENFVVGPAHFTARDLMSQPMPSGRKLPMAMEAHEVSLVEAWSEEETLWAGHKNLLAGMLAEHIGLPPEMLNKVEPSRRQVDDRYSAAEYTFGDLAYLVMVDKDSNNGSILRAKS